MIGGLIEALALLALYCGLVRLLRGCSHRHRGFPIGERERCLDCTRLRHYVIGAKPGPWLTEERFEQWLKQKKVEETKSCQLLDSPARRTAVRGFTGPSPAKWR